MLGPFLLINNKYIDIMEAITFNDVCQDLMMEVVYGAGRMDRQDLEKWIDEHGIDKEVMRGRTRRLCVKEFTRVGDVPMPGFIEGQLEQWLGKEGE